jgi:hypothetical protein
MNSSITCANAFHSKRTVPVITSFRDSVGCLSSDVPDHRHAQGQDQRDVLRDIRDRVTPVEPVASGM